MPLRTFAFASAVALGLACTGPNGECQPARTCVLELTPEEVDAGTRCVWHPAICCTAPTCGQYDNGQAGYYPRPLSLSSRDVSECQQIQFSGCF